jgi:putative hydrolase of HD superfamily
MKRPPIHRILELQKLLVDFRTVKRVVHIPGSRQEWENDVDHSYSLAMIGWFLAQYFSELNRDKVIRIALAHDIVEVHAGDTYLYGDEKLLATKKQREAEAFKKLQKEWADFPDMLVSIEAYEAKSSAEAKFVYALDKILPILLIYLGKGYTWQSEKITLAMLHAKKKETTALSPEIKKYYDELYKLLQQDSHLFHTLRTK